MNNKNFSHTNEHGKASMVDVGGKPNSNREAKAEGFIFLQNKTIELIKQNFIKKGDVLSISEFAGITAAKRTSDLIPLCHPLNITQVVVKAEIFEKGVKVESVVKCIGQTGAEMEALTAVQIALLTIYDMCKAVDKKMTINGVKLIGKTKTGMRL